VPDGTGGKTSWTTRFGPGVVIDIFLSMTVRAGHT
jgi:hypothetical protein